MAGSAGATDATGVTHGVQTRARPTRGARLVDKGNDAMELLGAANGTNLTGSRVDMDVALEDRGRQMVGQALANQDTQRLTLDLEGAEAEANPGVIYQVFLDLPAGADTSDEATYNAHFVGTLSFFGANHPRSTTDHGGPPGLRHSYDVTDVVRGLQSQGQWDPAHVAVTLEPLGLIPPEGTPPTAPQPHPPARIARVALYHH